MHPACCVASVLLIAAPAVSGENLLINPGFELEDVPVNGFVQGTATGWTQYADGTTFLFDRDTPSPDIWPEPFEGRQYCDIGNTATSPPLLQAVEIPVAGTYRLSWRASTARSAGAGDSAPYRVSILDASGGVVALLDTETRWGRQGTPWEAAGLFAGLAPGPHTVSFQPTNVPFTFDVLIDRVELVALASPCDIADTAPPAGVLNIDDVLVFLDAFASGNEAADVVPPFAVLNIDDVLTFLDAFAQGCP